MSQNSKLTEAEAKRFAEPPTTENIKLGSSVMIEIARPDGSTALHLGRFLGCSLSEVCVDHHSWVAQTGRRYLFLTGKPDGDVAIEVSAPEAVQRLPRWGSIVSDWPHELPSESK
jgi:hypothetical protein